MGLRLSCVTLSPHTDTSDLCIDRVIEGGGVKTCPTVWFRRRQVDTWLPWRPSADELVFTHVLRLTGESVPGFST